MSLSPFSRNLLIVGSLIAAAPALVFGQTNYVPNGVEYAIAGSLPGDQANPRLGLSVTGGYLVWEDNITDGDSLGISALLLDSGFSGSPAPLSSFRVNANGVATQEHPDVSLLKGGGAAFVWQGGRQGFQRIYARLISGAGVWLTGDLQVNTFSSNSQINPVVATLANSNLVVAWASFNQATPTSLQDVYAQLLSPTGQKVGGEFQVNQFTSYNQRNPAVAALSDGRFVVVWVSEQQRSLDAPNNSSGDLAWGAYAAQHGTASVDVYGRIFTAGGAPSGNEFLVSTNVNLCSSPQVAAGAGGTFMVVWAERDRAASPTGWDIWGRPFSSAGAGGTARCINTTQFGDQYLPRISWDGADYLVVWTGLAQDGSQEGIFGQLLQSNGTRDQGEFQVNTTWISQQKFPAVASDGQGRFLAAWATFSGAANGFDLAAQRYVNVSQPLSAMSAPFVYVPFLLSNGVYQPQVQVSWPAQAGLSIDHFDVYVNGVLAATVTTNVWLMTAANGAAPNATYSIQVDYVTTSQRVSPISPATAVTTWSGQSWGGIPWEWMTRYYGPFFAYWNGVTMVFNWPGAGAPATPGGPTLLQVFLTGADPTDPGTWLRTAITSTAQGYFLIWNPQPGLTYQVQESTNLAQWANAGSPRIAAGTVDSLYIGLSHARYYRVLCLH